MTHPPTDTIAVHTFFLKSVNSAREKLRFATSTGKPLMGRSNSLSDSTSEAWRSWTPTTIRSDSLSPARRAVHVATNRQPRCAHAFTLTSSTLPQRIHAPISTSDNKAQLDDGYGHPFNAIVHRRHASIRTVAP
ncbi:MAG: hypothetical protein LBK72_06200 [Bifidobacteriaceae bacterium]|nr:hypothetical protein [Bifidobacteriaceae bacterium]